MARTAAEQAELDALQQQSTAYQASQMGAQVTAQAGASLSANSTPPDPSAETSDPGAPKLPAPPKDDTSTQPFSWTRAFLGGARDFVNDVEGFGQTLANASNAFENRSGISAALGEGTLPTNGKTNNLIFAPMQGEEHAGALEKGLRQFTSFVIPFTGYMKAFGAMRAVSELGEAPGVLARVAQTVAAGTATDITAQDPHLNNFADAIRHTFGIDNPTLQSLSTENDPDSIEARLKAAATNILPNAALEGIFQLGGKAIQLYRASRGMNGEAAAVARAIEADHGLPSGYMEETAADAQAHAQQAVAEQAPKPAGEAEAPIAAPEAPTEAPEERPFDPSKDVSTDNQPKSFEDVTQFLANKAGDLGLNEDALKALGERLIDQPGSALKELGIDVKALDAGALEDPTALGRVVAGLRDIHETIAARLGRTGITVPESEIATAGRYFATSMDTVKDLFGSTQDLPGKLFAVRLIAEANRMKLVASAQDALAALKAGLPGTEQWGKMSEDFFRHAYLNGAVRGASSEVGRTLRSLQMTVKSAATAAFSPEAKAAAETSGDPIESASRLLANMESPADKILFLQKLLDKAADGGDLSRWVRTKANSPLEWLGKASKEMVNNLWTTGTSVKIVGSGAIQMFGLTPISKIMVSLGRGLLSPFSGDQAFRARVATMDLWAHVDGSLQAWGTAFRSAFAIIQKSTLEELALNLDGLGLRDLAAKVAAQSTDAAAHIQDPTKFIRPDLVGTKVISVDGASQAAFNKMVDGWDLNTVASMGLKGLFKAASVPINAAGSITRLGSNLVASPDNFLALLRQRAGAQSYAVQIAANQAAEMGLTGKELSTYLRAKVIQLTETSMDGLSKIDPVLAGQRDAAFAQGTADAQHMLFHDDPQTMLGKAAVSAFSSPAMNVFAPVVKTPTRILETVWEDYLKPWAPIQAAMQRATIGGGQKADEAMARLAIGAYALYSAYQLADAHGLQRAFVGDDGGYKSSARMAGRPSMSFKFGADVVDFSGIEPLGSLFGIAADIKEYMAHSAHDPDAVHNGFTMVKAGIMSLLHVVLDKSMLTELSNVAQLADTSDPASFEQRAAKYAGQLLTRYVPGSGISKGLDRISDGSASISKDTPAHIVWDSFLKALPFGTHFLSPVRDQLGYPQTLLEGERATGYKMGIESTDPLRKEMARLAFDLPEPPPVVAKASSGAAGLAPDPLKVKLNGDQYSRFLELRGHVVKGANGLTMEDSLRQLINAPQYKSAPYGAQVAYMKKAMDHYGQAAMGQLVTEDHNLYSQILRAHTYNVGELQGMTMPQKQTQYEQLAKNLGLPVIRN